MIIIYNTIFAIFSTITRIQRTYGCESLHSLTSEPQVLIVFIRLSQISGVRLTDSDFHIFSVEEITSYIKQKLTYDKNLQDIWISGEISNFVHHSSGHFYFTLKDDKSQLPCAMFRWANENIKFEPRDGMKVLTKGNVDVYAPQGRYNFVISEIHLKGTGELYLKYMQLKEKLQKEGLFEIVHKKPIPKYPHKVGVVTSPTGAALRDIVNVTKRRFPLTGILVVPTLVQGESAKDDIVNSIRIINRMHVDVAIVGRGGGSIEDLWPFNEEVVARAVFESEIPIISAVGHETDFTICDFAADLRAATPSAAAELVVPDKNDVSKEIKGRLESMVMNMQGIIAIDQKHVEGISSALKPRILCDRIITYQQSVDALTSNLNTYINHKISLCQGKFEALSEMLDAVSPLSTLKRGYSITQKLPQETVVGSVDMVSEGDDVKVILHDGELRCRINELKRGKQEENSDNKKG